MSSGSPESSLSSGPLEGRGPGLSESSPPGGLLAGRRATRSGSRWLSSMSASFMLMVNIFQNSVLQIRHNLSL